MNVLSLFGGIETGLIALKELGVKIDNYYSSEVDKYASSVARYNHPEIKELGTVADYKNWDLPNIDLILAGPPCQGFSIAGKGLNWSDPRSQLFFTAIEILWEYKPKYFLFENVASMKKEIVKEIDELMGVDSVKINSALVSAQNRDRMFWNNMPGPQLPNDKNIKLIQILNNLPDCPIGARIREKSKCVRVGGRNSPYGAKQEWDSPFQRITKKAELKKGIEKSACLTGGAHSGGNHSDMDIIHTPFATRRYSVIECERLQTLPYNTTKYGINKVGGHELISNSQRYKMIGNGWTKDVIKHILRGIL